MAISNDNSHLSKNLRLTASIETNRALAHAYLATTRLTLRGDNPDINDTIPTNDDEGDDDDNDNNDPDDSYDDDPITNNDNKSDSDQDRLKDEFQDLLDQQQAQLLQALSTGNEDNRAIAEEILQKCGSIFKESEAALKANKVAEAHSLYDQFLQCLSKYHPLKQ